MDLAGTGLARGMEHLARSIRTMTVVVFVLTVTAVAALAQFDRSWGVVPLHDGAGASSSAVAVVKEAAPDEAP